MTVITPMRTRVAEGTGQTRAAEPKLVALGTSEYGSITPRYRDDKGPLGKLPVAVVIEGDRKDTNVVYKSATDDNGELKIAIIAGCKPTTFLMTVTPEGGSPRQYRVTVK